METTKVRLLKCQKKYLSFLKKQEILGEPFYDKLGQLKKYYLPICNRIFSSYKKEKKINIVGLSGGQGSGKSTITQIIKIILENLYGLNVVFFSIDDFYKTLKERKELSKKKHELFLTRGVPGTHDTKLLNKIFNVLMKKQFKIVHIPQFDKSSDDRFPKSKWIKISKRPQIIIFEGWCIGAKSENNKELKRPINILEKNYDNKLTWRKQVNNELKKNYLKIFKKINHLIFLKVPNFQSVYRWRLLQEHKLQLILKNKKTMSSNQIKKFIMYYERTTKQMLKDLPHRANTVLYLDKKHKLTKIKFN